MCWGTPAVVVDIDENNMMAKVDFGDGILRDVLIGISSERLSKGDIVIVHAGVVISKLSPEGILDHINFIKELLGEEASNIVDSFQTLVSLARTLKGESYE